MIENQIPVPLARLAMRAMPARVLQPMLDRLMTAMRHRRPALFRNLERLDTAVVRIEPTDLPHQFTLAFGKDGVRLAVGADPRQKVNAGISGKLQCLIDLLEGRVDGDRLFFSRDIAITGDTAVVVALRNTIDREEINLLDDFSGLFGSFAYPARRAVLLLDKTAQKLKKHLAQTYAADQPAEDNSVLQRECEQLRSEVQQLKSRLAKFDVREKKTKALAT